MTKARDIASAIPAPSTVSSAELGYLDGVTSAIQTQLDAKTAKSTLSTTGDIYYASAANTPARLGIGSTDQVLKVTAGVPAWATPAGGGGYTLLSTTTLSGTSTTISDIDQTYKHLFMIGNLISVTSGGENVGFRLNGDTGSNYKDTYFYFTSGNHGAGSDTTANPVLCGYNTTTGWDGNSSFQTWIYRYTETETKIIQNIGHTSTSAESRTAKIGFNSTSAITSITILTNGGHTFSTGTVRIYGVK